jgi:hypothetical protein
LGQIIFKKVKKVRFFSYPAGWLSAWTSMPAKMAAPSPTSSSKFWISFCGVGKNIGSLFLLLLQPS